MGLAGKDSKTVILNMFKDLEEVMSIRRREREDMKKNQMGILELRMHYLKLTNQLSMPSSILYTEQQEISKSKHTATETILTKT